MSDVISREKVASFMMLHGIPTGHGDTIDDLLVELSGCLREKQNNTEALKSLVWFENTVREQAKLLTNVSYVTACELVYKEGQIIRKALEGLSNDKR
jgi:hypothetical protein